MQAKRSKQRWQQDVVDAAPALTELLRGRLRLRIDFFFVGATDLDIDNIIKPIADALQQVVYDNDREVVEVRARKFDRHNARLVSPPALLVDAIEAKQDGDFVFIQVDTAPDEAGFA